MKELLSNVSDQNYLISVTDIPLLKEIFNEAGRDSWAYFAPFLACYSLPPKRPLYLTKNNGVFCLFQYSGRVNAERIDLVIPPSKLTIEVKRYLLKIKDFMHQTEMRILWIDSSDVCTITDLFGRNIKIQKREDEYIYDPKVVFELPGKRYKDVRKRINKMAKNNPVFFELEKDDVSAALDVLDKWRSVQGKRNKFLFDWGYTRAALNAVGLFDTDDVKSWGLEVDRQLVGFSMAGPINQKTACFFVAKTLVGLKGVSEYLRWKTFETLQGYDFVNDASDLGIEGLKQYKRKFRPDKMRTVYTATI